MPTTGSAPRWSSPSKSISMPATVSSTRTSSSLMANDSRSSHFHSMPSSRVRPPSSKLLRTSSGKTRPRSDPVFFRPLMFNPARNQAGSKKAFPQVRQHSAPSRTEIFGSSNRRLYRISYRAMTPHAGFEPAIYRLTKRPLQTGPMRRETCPLHFGPSGLGAYLKPDGHSVAPSSLRFRRGLGGRMTGLEPAFTSSTNWRLDHFAFMRHQAGDRTRSDNLFVGNEALYPIEIHLHGPRRRNRTSKARLSQLIRLPLATSQPHLGIRAQGIEPRLLVYQTSVHTSRRYAGNRTAMVGPSSLPDAAERPVPRRSRGHDVVFQNSDDMLFVHSRDDWNRTSDLLLPRQARFQAALHPANLRPSDGIVL